MPAIMMITLTMMNSLMRSLVMKGVRVMVRLETGQTSASEESESGETNGEEEDEQSTHDKKGRPRL